MRGTGTVAGVPDTIWIRGGQVYALEVKPENGKLTAAQEHVLIKLREAGAIAAHAQGLDEALRWLEGHGLLRGQSS